MPLKNGRVIIAYKSEFSDPLKLKSGDLVEIKPKETIWAGWLWCIDRQGVQGWIPENFIDHTESIKTGKLNRDYNATELTVEPDEKLEVYFKESSWYFCCRANGEKGWIPADNLEVKEA